MWHIAPFDGTLQFVDAILDSPEAYVRVSRYFFYALVVLGLSEVVTGAFAQSSQVQPTLSNVGCPATAAGRGGIVYSCHGTVNVASQLKEIALRGNLTVITHYRNASTLAKSFNFMDFPQLVRHLGTEDWSRWNEGEVPVRIALIRPKTNYRYYTF